MPFFLCSGILVAFVLATEEEVVFPSQEKVLGNLLCWPCFEKQCWSRWYPEVPSNLTHSVIPYQGVGLISQEQELLWTSTCQAPEKYSKRDQFTARSPQPYQLCSWKPFFTQKCNCSSTHWVTSFLVQGFLRCFNSVCTSKWQELI